jgi:hypothetical protein
VGWPYVYREVTSGIDYKGVTAEFAARKSRKADFLFSSVKHTRRRQNL